MNDESYKFSLHFEGPKLETHLIEADELATSLLGLNSALKLISNKILPSNKSTLQVSAELKQGSVISELIFTAFALTPLLAPQIISSAKDIVDMLVNLLRLKKEYAEKVPDSETFNVTFNNCNIGFVAKEIYTDKNFNKSVKKFCSPIKNKEADSLKLEDSHGLLIEISRNEVDDIDKEILENEEGETMKQQVWVTLDGPRLASEAAWDLKAENMPSFKAKIHDEDFLSRVRDRGILFGAGDQMKVELEVTQKNGGFSFVVAKVLDYKKAAQNLSLGI